MADFDSLGVLVRPCLQPWRVSGVLFVTGIAMCAISKVYPGGVASLQDVDLTVEPGEFVTVVGASGSGKSTLLRLIAGLETPTTGQLLLDDRPSNTMPPWERGLAMVFQEQAPYPHLNVYENLGFSLRASRASRSEVRDRVTSLARLLKLEGLLDRSPSTLSGGERRRVVLGRSIAKRPRILLLDEPLSGLDAPLRSSTRDLLAELHQQFGMTTVLVTHDQAEALALGHRVAVLSRGRLIQYDSPDRVYDQPATLDVARFVGEPPMNLLPARLDRDAEGTRLSLSGMANPPSWRLASGGFDAAGPEGHVVIGLRPHQLNIINTCSGRGTMLLGTVRQVETTGPVVSVVVDVATTTLRAASARNQKVSVGDQVAIRWDLGAACWFDPESGRRLTPPNPLQSDH